MLGIGTLPHNMVFKHAGQVLYHCAIPPAQKVYNLKLWQITIAF
jgi:hypothetical protein